MREDWIKLQLKDVGKIISGGTPKTAINDYWGHEVSWITPADLSGYHQKFISKGKKSITKKGLENSSAKLMPAGSVLFSSRAPIGYTVIAKNELTTNQGFKSLVPYSILDSEYIFYYFKCSKQLAESKASGTTFKELSAKAFSLLPIPLAPLPEQRAIVGKIEQLFSELDNGIANLKAAREKLDIYRQAVLKKAFEGELTRGWRESLEQDGKRLPDAQDLLEQIKAERKAYYQQQLKAWQQSVIAWDAQGRKGKKPGKPKIVKEMPPISEAEYIILSLLPKKWKWVYLGGIFSNTPQNGLYKPADQYGDGIDIIRIDDFYSGKLIKYFGFKKVKLTPEETDNYLLKNGQLLINRVNSIEYLGKCGLVENLASPTVFESNIMKIELLETYINPRFVSLYLSSIIGINEIRKNAKHAVNQASINQNDVSATLFPLCSIQEQNQIIQEIETRLSVCDKLGASIDESLEKAEALRQSILKKAFEGKLLSEAELAACRKEADWEPATQLLERIQGKKEGVQGKLFEKGV